MVDTPEDQPELPLNIPTEAEAAAMPDRGYKPEWEEQSVKLFLAWKADVDAAKDQNTILKTDAMKGFNPIPGNISARFSYLGKTLPATTIALASELAARFVAKEWLDAGDVDDLRRKSEREMSHMTSFLDEMETAQIVCKTCRHNVPGLQPLVSAHCLIGIVGRWLKDVPRMGRALALMDADIKAAPRPHRPSQP